MKVNTSALGLMALVAATMTACGGGGSPAAVSDFTPVASGGNVSTVSQSSGAGLRALSDLARARYGYGLAQWLSARLPTVYGDSSADLYPVASVVSTVTCSGSGNASYQWLDNDRDGKKSVRDQFIVNYQACARDATIFNGQAELTLLTGGDYEITSSWADGDNKLNATLRAALRSTGNYSFSMADTGFTPTGGSLRYNGLDLELNNLRVDAGQDAQKNQWTLDFDLSVYNAGSNALDSGIDFSPKTTPAGREFQGPIGGNPTTGNMSALAFFDVLRSVDLRVAPDPAYVLIVVDSSLLATGDESTTQMTWSDFLKQ